MASMLFFLAKILDQNYAIDDVRAINAFLNLALKNVSPSPKEFIFIRLQMCCCIPLSERSSLMCDGNYSPTHKLLCNFLLWKFSAICSLWPAPDSERTSVDSRRNRIVFIFSSDIKYKVSLL